MVYEVVYREGYKDFGGIGFPIEIDQHFGDPRVTAGHNILALAVNDVSPNVAIAAVPVPEVVRQATVPPVRVESREIADGVWFLGGGSHNSVAVEFGDFVTVIEAPLNEARSLAVIAEVDRLTSNKPIRYLVNTHHHFDHLGGVRTYAARGSIIVTHGMNRVYYDEVLFASAPRTLEPDLFALAPRYGSWRPYIVSVGWERAQEGGKYVINDGARSLEIHAVPRLDHARDMLIAYLPGEKILVNADMWSPSPQPPATRLIPRAIALFEIVSDLNLEVEEIVGLHGGVGPMSDLERFARQAVATGC